MIPRLKSKKNPALIDLAKGRLGTWVDFETTEDEKWSNVVYIPTNSIKSKKIWHVPTGAWLHIPPGFCPEMYEHGIYYLLAAENGESPIASGKLKAEFSAILLAKNKEIENLKGRAIASDIYARRAVQDIKTSLLDHAEIEKITRKPREEEQAKSPFLRRPRFEEEV